MAFESAFKAIDNTLRHDDGCSTALDYVEQSSWVLFLKYFDDLEITREQAAEQEEKPSRPFSPLRRNSLQAWMQGMFDTSS